MFLRTRFRFSSCVLCFYRAIYWNCCPCLFHGHWTGEPANNRLQPYSIVKGPKYRFNSLDEDVRSELTQPLVQTANESVTIFTLRRF